VSICREKDEGRVTRDMVIRAAKIPGSGVVNMHNTVSPYDVQRARGGATEDGTREAGDAASSFA